MYFGKILEVFDGVMLIIYVVFGILFFFSFLWEVEGEERKKDKK